MQRAQEGGFVFLIEEFAGGGDLVNFLFAYGGKVPEAVFVKRIARPLFCAVQYMHAQGIMHRCVPGYSPPPRPTHLYKQYSTRVRIVRNSSPVMQFGIGLCRQMLRGMA